MDSERSMSADGPNTLPLAAPEAPSEDFTGGGDTGGTATVTQAAPGAMLEAGRSLSMSPAAPPAQVPGYEVLGELGRGGMGVVYKARHLQLGRLVALKMILSAEHAAPQDLARFRAEAEALARLQHPNIVQIFEVGAYNGRPFFALEYLEGGSLAARLDGTPWEPRKAAALVETLARAVHAAHLHKVVHRDLKPANVLLAADGAPKVTDFGLAKKMDADDGLSRTGQVMGTPSYMPPEQAAGKTHEIGPAADVYALGAILYELLTGRPPFKGPTAVDTLLQVVRDDPAPPRQLQSRTPKDLETVCLKCLRKEPPNRYADAAALAEDLRRFQAGEPVRARAIGAFGRGWRWCRRRPAAALALLVVVLSLLTATAVSLWFGLHAEEARRAEADRARGEAAAKGEAQQARRDAQRQLIDLCGASGLTAAKEDDPSLALLWFARAVSLAGDEPERQGLNRVRAADCLRHVCRPDGAFAVPGFRNHQDRFRTFQFSPDGKYLLIVAGSGTGLVWDRAGERQVPLPDPAGDVLAAAWGPKDGVLAVAGKDGRIRLLSPPTFQPVEEITADGAVSVVAFSRDGQRLAWGGVQGARIWDRGKKEYLGPLLAHPAPVTTLSFSASGELLATSAGDLKARVFRVGSDDGEPLFPPVPHVRKEHGLAHGGADRVAPRFAADDQALLTVETTPQDTHCLVWRSAVSGRLLKVATPPAGAAFLTAFAVSPQGNQAAVVWEDKGQLWDARTRTFLDALPAGSRYNWYEDVDFAADGKTLLTCGHDMAARGWSVDDRSNGALVASFPPVLHSMKVVRADLSPDGRRMAAALWDGTISLWRLPEGLPPVYSVAAGGTTLPALSPDGRFVLPAGTTFRNGTQRNTRVYNADTGEAAGPVLDPDGILLNAIFSPDGALVATASSTAHTAVERNGRLFEPDGKAGNVQLWDWRTGKRLVGPIAMPCEPRGLAFRPNGRTLAVVCADYRVVLLDPATGSITHDLDPGIHTRPLNANLWWGNGEARFSPDGRFLVTWEMAPPVHVWDPDTGHLLYTLPHNERVERVAFSAAAPTLLATGGRDSIAYVWDLADGKALARLQHPSNLNRVRFSPDGRELITSCIDGMMRVWDWRAGKLKDGLALHASPIMDFDFTADRRWLVTLGHEDLQVTDWPAKTPAGLPWPLDHSIHLALDVPPGDRRVIVGGFGGALVGYDLGKMTTPTDLPAQDLVRLAEAAAGRRILSEGSVVPLSSSESLERWQKLSR